MFSLENVENCTGFIVFSLKHFENALVLLCFCSKMLKKRYVLYEMTAAVIKHDVNNFSRENNEERQTLIFTVAFFVCQKHIEK